MPRFEGLRIQRGVVRATSHRYSQLLTYVLYERSYSAYIHLEIHPSDTICN